MGYFHANDRAPLAPDMALGASLANINRHAGASFESLLRPNHIDTHPLHKRLNACGVTALFCPIRILRGYATAAHELQPSDYRPALR